MNTKLLNLNDSNGDSEILSQIHKKLLIEFPNENLIGAEFGIAHGGGIESICKCWKNRGFVYAFDTFIGHPKHLSKDINSFEAVCMDGWYKEFGKDKLQKNYIETILKSENLNNFKLIPGEVNKDSANEIEKLHYVLIDLDIVEPMKIVYESIKNKMVKNGYICIHDVIPQNHLKQINSWWYNEVMVLDEYIPYCEGKYLGVYKVK